MRRRGWPAAARMPPCRRTRCPTPGGSSRWSLAAHGRHGPDQVPPGPAAGVSAASVPTPDGVADAVHHGADDADEAGGDVTGAFCGQGQVARGGLEGRGVAAHVVPPGRRGRYTLQSPRGIPMSFTSQTQPLPKVFVPSRSPTLDLEVEPCLAADVLPRSPALTPPAASVRISPERRCGEVSGRSQGPSQGLGMQR